MTCKNTWGGGKKGVAEQHQFIFLSFLCLPAVRPVALKLNSLMKKAQRFSVDYILNETQPY